MPVVAFRFVLLFVVAGVAGCGESVRKEVAACDRRGNSESVLQLCTKALALADLTAEERSAVLFSRGSIHANREEWDAARADFLAIRQVDPKSPYAPRGLAYLERRAGNNNEALVLYEEAIRLAPDDATLVGLRGGAKFGLGQYEEAVRDLDLALDPPSPMHVDKISIDGFRQLRGMSLVELRHYGRAVDDLDHWLKTNPDEAWGLLYRGIAFVEQGQVGRGIVDFDAAMNNGGSVIWLRDRLSRDNGYFFGPGGASYESGVRYALKTIERLDTEYPALNEQTLNRRRDEVFPSRIFGNAKFLFALETGLAPLTLLEGEPVGRAASSYYYAALINTLNSFNDPACQAVVKSLDQLAGDLATAKDVLKTLGESQSGGEALFRGLVILIGAPFIQEIAADDAAMLASRHGCGSDVVVNVLENGSKYLEWSMSL